MNRTHLTASLLLACLLATSAARSESQVLTCSDLDSPPTPGVCGVLEAAPKASTDDPRVRKAVEVWRRLEGPFRSLSGRETALTVLGPEARIGRGDASRPVPPAAIICPGAPPTVYVPWTLVELVYEVNEYPEDFLAFVLGHELGHRMNDLTPDGCQLAAFQRPGKGAHEEELADARSAFFIANAGFSPRTLAREDLVSRFLQAEFQLGRHITDERKGALVGALRHADTWEALYQVALGMALTGEMEAADRLLTWADELVTAQGVPLPELRVVRAIVRIDRAAEAAPWLQRTQLGSAPVHSLRCTPLHPGHSSLWEEPPTRRVRAADTDRAERMLREAVKLLDEAESLGATPFTVSAARACAAFYLGESGTARRAQARAADLLPEDAPAAVRAALAANGDLVAFQGYVEQHPAPEADATKAWIDGLREALGGAPNDAGLAGVVAALEDPSAGGRGGRRGRGGDGPACESKQEVAARVPDLPEMPAEGCPEGWKLAHRVPGADASARTGSTQEVRVCAREGAGRAWLVRVHLPGATEPPLEAVDRTMLMLDDLPEPLRSLDAWACHCPSLRRHAVSDRGEVVYNARCNSLGLPRGAVRVREGRVTGVIVYPR